MLIPASVSRISEIENIEPPRFFADALKFLINRVTNEMGIGAVVIDTKGGTSRLNAGAGMISDVRIFLMEPNELNFRATMTAVAMMRRAFKDEKYVGKGKDVIIINKIRDRRSKLTFTGVESIMHDLYFVPGIRFDPTFLKQFDDEPYTLFNTTLPRTSFYHDLVRTFLHLDRKLGIFEFYGIKYHTPSKAILKLFSHTLYVLANRKRLLEVFALINVLTALAISIINPAPTPIFMLSLLSGSAFMLFAALLSDH